MKDFKKQKKWGDCDTKFDDVFYFARSLFYKTKYKGRIESEENKQLKKEIKEYIKKETENGNYIDINTVRKAFNKRK